MLGRWRRRTALLALLALGTALRLWAVGHARFTGDESSFWDTARAIASLERFPALGPEITGSPAHLPGPLFHYLTALPQLLGDSPYWGGAFIALLHVLAGALLARFALDARGPRAALLALALWAFAPWDVLYGDRVWASCLAPVLGTLALYAAHRAHQQPRWMAALVLLAGALPQVHLSAPLVWGAAAVLLALRRPAPGWRRPALAGLGGVVLLHIPFLVVELGSGFENTRAILAHSGGEESGLGVVLVPLKVFGYAVLYATGELGYQFARGYWGGGFDELAAYGTAGGWRDWGASHGPVLGALVALSVVLALGAWGRFLWALPGEVRRARRPASDAGSEDAPSPASDAGSGDAPLPASAAGSGGALLPSSDAALGLALLAALAVGSALMMSARKPFYPHYANILMPFALWPAVSGLDRLFAARGRAGRWVLGLALAGSVAGMGANTVRYYLEVDTLNGLRTTLALVERVLDEETPVALRFTHFRNEYAWRKLAAGYFDAPLSIDARAPVRFVVKNHARGAEGGERVGPVTLERTERPRVAPPDAARFVAVRDWREGRVRVSGAEGLEGCSAASGACRYGPNPWQRFEPVDQIHGDRLERVLFMHPVSSATVAVRFPRSGEATRAVLRFGLSDPALRSTNEAPVQVVLRSEEHVLLRTRTSTAPGLARREVELPPGGGEIELAIWTKDDGARVFGFDLWLLRD